MAKIKNVLCVHQGFELYGSDRSFASAVDVIQKTIDADITVKLPKPGPIASLFEKLSVTVEYSDLFVLRKTDIVKSVSYRIIKTITSVMRAVQAVKYFDLTYVNTCVIIDYLIAGILVKKTLVVHVREIPSGLAMRLIRSLLSASKATLIFNSNATKQAFRLPNTLDQHVIWNGFDDPGIWVRPPIQNRNLRVLCIGRLNSWKGQDVLVKACALLSKGANIDVHIVGGVFSDQTHFISNLENLIGTNNLETTVKLLPFSKDPAEHYQWADIVVVPSTKPEPFGRVAIEAMAFGCATIATNHGGLPEIVVEGTTGLLVEPSDPEALAQGLRYFLTEPEIVSSYGLAGRRRFLSLFTQSAVDEQLACVMKSAAAKSTKISQPQ